MNLWTVVHEGELQFTIDLWYPQVGSKNNSINFLWFWVIDDWCMFKLKMVKLK